MVREWNPCPSREGRRPDRAGGSGAGRGPPCRRREEERAPEPPDTVGARPLATCQAVVQAVPFRL
ncbi:hypothetical protein GCM10010261_37850 [Streptomyces pilosus]|uniref:Uncharacterized protein n=1 Tax=Streptomyces pilosus TaxID=28893 RepID=A0A918BJ20_9ACTN|nr:hypothetical protein GCM10010280_14950 [Streptomyces pilosus]GGV54736.1 hypothetical protein GCM10010261_37850 [Streptomyces pilosus]